jgi:hypothetical protein
MDIPSLNFTSLAGLTAVGAIIATTWRHIATFGRYLVGIFIGTSILKDDAGAAAMAFAFNRAIRSPLGMRLFGGYESYVHPKRWRETVGYEGLSSDPIVIRYKKSFALISLLAGEARDAIGDIDNRNHTIKIRYFRWFFNIEQFTIDAIDAYNVERRQSTEQDQKKKKSRRINRFKITRFSGRSSYHNEDNKGHRQSDAPEPTLATKSGGIAEQMVMAGIYRLLKWSREDLQVKPEEGQSAFTGYPFPKEVESAIKELQLWLAHEKWFRSKSIPWRRGWLLHGVPGTGKSTLVRALGMSFDLPVYIFDLAGMTNDDLVKSWDEMMSNTPCIALIEDIDSIFDGRNYVGSTNANVPHLTFDCLLNCISGVKQADGVFLIVTTNHLEKLDPAIGIPDTTGKSTRPGRIDKALHLGLMAEEQRLMLAKHILSDYPELVDETVKAGEGETPAQFQARCAQLALSKFWTEGKVISTEDSYEEVIHIENQPGEPPASSVFSGNIVSPARPHIQ